LKAKLLVIAEEQRASEIKKQIRGDAVKAEWGQQIRSYIFHPYKLVKDLRTGCETSDVTYFCNGWRIGTIHQSLPQNTNTLQL